MHALFDDRRYLIPFRATLLSQIFTDVLVVGGGVAGLRAAVAAAEHSEVIVTLKGGLMQSNTAWAQGGIAATVDADDTCESHIQDTLTAGAGLCDEPIVRQVVEAGPRCIADLVRWGMRFDQATHAGDELRHALGREGGHAASRILHADGDATGRELARVLAEQAQAHEAVRVFEQCFVLDLITVEGQPPRCIGAITHHPKYGLQVIWAKAVILASGGCGQVYRESTNPAVATGDGLAMAFRAGAQLADMALMQFHPTTLYVAGASRSLITEAVRGEGALLVDREGQRFMPDYHELAELAPRDIVSRAILAQLAKTGATYVYLDCRPIGGQRFAQRFPGITRLLNKFNLDPGRDPIPIHPSAHYMIGGVRTDDQARTNIRGLYAAGEVACTGLHGANRLASNSLLEGLAFGEIAGRACQEVTGNGPAAPAKVVSDIPLSDRSELDLGDVASSLRSVMWRHMGIMREGKRLDEVAEMVDFWAQYTLDKIFDEQTGWEVQNMLLIAALMTRSARWRQESRGAHHRIDAPKPSLDYAGHDLWNRGQPNPTFTPVQTQTLFTPPHSPHPPAPPRPLRPTLWRRPFRPPLRHPPAPPPTPLAAPSSHLSKPAAPASSRRRRHSRPAPHRPSRRGIAKSAPPTKRNKTHTPPLPPITNRNKPWKPFNTKKGQFGAKKGQFGAVFDHFGSISVPHRILTIPPTF